MKIQLLLITLATFIALFNFDEIDAKPLDTDSTVDNGESDDESAKLDGKIEFDEDKTERIVIEPLSEEEKRLHDARPKKSQRNYPVYFVKSQVNGRFGKSIQAFTADEFYEMYPIH